VNRPRMRIVCLTSPRPMAAINERTPNRPPKRAQADQSTTTNPVHSTNQGEPRPSRESPASDEPGEGPVDRPRRHITWLTSPHPMAAINDHTPNRPPSRTEADQPTTANPAHPTNRTQPTNPSRAR